MPHGQEPQPQNWEKQWRPLTYIPASQVQPQPQYDWRPDKEVPQAKAGALFFGFMKKDSFQVPKDEAFNEVGYTKRTESLPSDQKRIMLKLFDFGFLDFDKNLEVTIEQKGNLNAIVVILSE